VTRVTKACGWYHVLGVMWITGLSAKLVSETETSNNSTYCVTIRCRLLKAANTVHIFRNPIHCNYVIRVEAQMPSWSIFSRHVKSLSVVLATLVAFASNSYAQKTNSAPIQVETREVVLPVLVFKEKKDPKTALIGPDGTWHPTWRVYVERVNNLTKNSVRSLKMAPRNKLKVLPREISRVRG
jgi:hypothetical protein